jgi:DNA-binding response OmpR family regulator
MTVLVLSPSVGRAFSCHRGNAVMPGRILIVDDDYDIRTMLRDRLRALGYTVWSVRSGRAAISFVGKSANKASAINGIMVDLDMPKMDGMRVIREIRDRLPQVPIMMMSATANVDALKKACQEGASDYVLKPIDLDILKQKCRAIFHGRSSDNESCEGLR